MEASSFVFYLVGCFLLSLAVNLWLLRRNKRHHAAVSTHQQERWQSQSKPAVGGISFMVVLLFSSAFALYTLGVDQNSGNDGGGWQSVGLLLSGLLAFVVGRLDDVRHLKPRWKLIMQFACTGLLIATGNHIEAFDLQWVNLLITIVWVIGVMNAVNMLDNMDGITATVAIFICLFLVLVGLGQAGGLNFSSWLYAGIAAGLFGFLLFNWHPSRIYMGDSGSMLLGVLLAAGGIRYGWNVSTSGFEVRTLLIPGLVFLIPIADTTVVTINRVLHGVSPATGGRDHTTHNLSYLGVRDNMVAVIFSFLSMIGTTLALILAYGETDNMLTLISGAWMVLVIGGFFGISRFNLSRGKYSY